MNEHISAVPTNIITGFLGVGKTSAISNLLKDKPSDERWAVLVNEFGEVGIDGSLFSGEHTESNEVFIREVPGGCMCCAAGLPMQVALNQLLSKARPHRLLIEPTGLGHPLEIVDILSSDHYRETLSLEKIITLVDARKVSDRRYTGYATFNQQIHIADVVVGNKHDLYSAGDEAKLEAYVRLESSDRPIYFTEQGRLDLEWLTGRSRQLDIDRHSDQHSHSHKDIEEEPPIPSLGYIKLENSGEGYESVGWRFSSSLRFNRAKLLKLFGQLKVERLKGVFITEEAVIAYNCTNDTLNEYELDDCFESRIEFIALKMPEHIEDGLLDCIVNGPE